MNNILCSTCEAIIIECKCSDCMKRPKHQRYRHKESLYSNFGSHWCDGHREPYVHANYNKEESNDI